MLLVAEGFLLTEITCCIITHRLHQTVCAAFVYEALVDRWHPHAGEGSRLSGVPAWPAPHREAGRAVGPHRLSGAGGLVHQEHGGVDELSPASRGVEYSWKRSGASCCRVGPGGGRHRGHAARPGIQAVLVLSREQKISETHSVYKC